MILLSSITNRLERNMYHLQIVTELSFIGTKLKVIVRLLLCNFIDIQMLILVSVNPGVGGNQAIVM